MTTYEVFQPKMPLNAFPRETIAKQTQMFSCVYVHIQFVMQDVF